MKFQLSINRFEGARQQIAILLTDDGTQISFPKALPLKSAEAGDTL